MRILLAHNYYRFPGGEDQVFAGERDLLESHGHSVIQYTVRNTPMSPIECVRAAKNTIWNGTVYKEFRSMISRGRPDVVHFHNTFPMISPAAYYAAAAEGIPVVQTLHNYRMMCPAANLFRNGRICEDCLQQHSPLPGVLHSCYRRSRTATVATAGMIAFHNAIATWTAAVDTYIAPSGFVRRKFIQAGLPERKIVVKPNFVDPPQSCCGNARKPFVLFAGRLSAEKGIRTLIAAWEQARVDGQLRIAGEGPLSVDVRNAATRTQSILRLGQQSNVAIRRLMSEAQAVVVPSEWYEPFGNVVIEAYAERTPVIASDIGGLNELILPGMTGLLFKPGDISDLAQRISWTFSHPTQLRDMGERAFQEFTWKYGRESNYAQLMSIYQRNLPSVPDVLLAKGAATGIKESIGKEYAVPGVNGVSCSDIRSSESGKGSVECNSD